MSVAGQGGHCTRSVSDKLTVGRAADEFGFESMNPGYFH